MRHAWKVLVALVLLVGGTAILRPGHASAATTATYNLWSWNIAGAAMHGGSTSDGLIDAAVASIQNRDADFVSFNEICQGQYNAFVAKLRAVGWPQDDSNFARFTESKNAATCGSGGQPYGNAIFSRVPLGGAQRFTLPSDGSTENRTLTCVSPTATPHLRFCTTHITTSNVIGPDGNAYNVDQLNAALNQLETDNTNGDTVLIAGDFNAQPHYARLNNWYSSSLNVANNGANTGHYRELDDNDASHCLGYGEWTSTGTPGAAPPCSATQPLAKIDLMFVRDNRLAGSYSEDSLAISTGCSGIAATANYPAGSCSDHRIIIGTVTVTIN